MNFMLTPDGAAIIQKMILSVLKGDSGFENGEVVEASPEFCDEMQRET